jgi:serine/threonine-protein kinase
VNHPLLNGSSIDQAPDAYLNAIGEVFAVFARTQDSGNVSYGVRIGDERYFVKTAGQPDNPQPYLRHEQRVALLRNAVRLWSSSRHPVLPRLHQVIESPQGPLLVYEWADGELIGANRQRRDDPNSPFQRFRRLPVEEILHALDVVYELHDELARAGWIAVDFYDGCLIYDFERRALRIMDLDTYQEGPFINEMGRMFGSSRFMAPEEFERGALIDQRTNVFTLGRTAFVLLSDGTLTRSTFRGDDGLYEVAYRACRDDRQERYESVAAFCAAWQQAR